MKYSTAAVFAAIATVVSAQLGDLPACPQSCILSNLGATKCGLVDIACSCRDLAYQAVLAECMAKCPPEEAAKGAEVGAAICKSAGVEITIPSITSTVPAPTPTPVEPAPTTVPTTAPTAVPTTPVEEPVEGGDDEEEEDDEPTSSTVPTTTPVSATPTSLITSVRPTGTSVVPVPTGSLPGNTTNGTITPPVATGIPGEEDSAAGRVVLSSLMGAAVMGAVAFAL